MTTRPDIHEYSVVVPNRERCDDWVELDEALDQAAAFLGLGCISVTVEHRVRAQCRECLTPLIMHPSKPSRCWQCAHINDLCAEATAI